MSNVMLEFNDVNMEYMGYLNPGLIKLTDHNAVFKNVKTGKVETINTPDIGGCFWSYLGGKRALRLLLKNGNLYRFGGFADSDYDTLNNFVQTNWGFRLEHKEQCCKGINHGSLKLEGSALEFSNDDQMIFEIPLASVSNVMAAKNELTMEFHQNDECPVSLMEIRFHIPADPNTDEDPAEEWKKNIISKAGVVQETGKALVVLEQILCATPRGRYDIKIYPTFLALHGKTFNYNIPISSILRLFLLPHMDGRRMFFVISLDPPIKQGQTRYNFLILELLKDEEVELELGLPKDVLEKKYEGQLQKNMQGLLFEVIAKIMKAIVRKRITVPGSFVGNSGTSAISCAYRSTSGYLYPMEKGFMFVHKPPLHIRLEEISSVYFDRSEVSTRSFDFEINVKSGASYTFKNIGREEYGKLYDFVNSKKLHIINIGKKKSAQDELDIFKGSSDEDEERDHYAEQLKNEARDRGDEESSETEDSDYDPSKVPDKVTNDSGSSSSSSSNEESEGESGGSSSARTEASEEMKSKVEKKRPFHRGSASSEDERKPPRKKPAETSAKSKKSRGKDKANKA